MFFASLYPQQRKLRDVDSIVSIRDGSFFGFIECDIEVPEALKDKFSEMGPILRTLKSREEL